MSTKPFPWSFTGVDLKTILPDRYTFLKRYWRMGPPERQITWLLDQNRVDDALVYFLHECGASFPGEIPFLFSTPDPDERIARLRSEGRIKLFMEGSKHRYRTRELVLAPNSGIEAILRDVAFLHEPANPAYSLPLEESSHE
jgi:hypothetical protein